MIFVKNPMMFTNWIFFGFRKRLHFWAGSEEKGLKRWSCFFLSDFGPLVSCFVFLEFLRHESALRVQNGFVPFLREEKRRQV